MHIYFLTKADLLTFQLYEASTNPKKKNKKMKGVWLLTGFFTLIAGSGYFNDNKFMLIYFSVCAILTVFLGPFYMAWKYKRHYTHYVDDTFKCINGEVKMKIGDLYIEEADQISESRFKISEITEVNEISTHYFIKVSSGQSIIITKENKELNNDIKQLIVHHKLKHNLMLDWKWN